MNSHQYYLRKTKLGISGREFSAEIEDNGIIKKIKVEIGDRINRNEKDGCKYIIIKKSNRKFKLISLTAST